MPLLAIFLMSFNTKEVYIEKPTNKIDLNTSRIQESTKSNEVKIIFNKDLSDKDLEKIGQKLQENNINFTYTGLKRNAKSEITSINTKFENDGGHCIYNANNNPIESFYFSKNKKSFGVGPVKPKEFTIEQLNQELKLFSVTITKDFTDDDFKRIIKEAKENGVTLKFKNIKRNSKNEITTINAEFKNEKGSGNFNLNGKEPIKSFAYNQNKKGFGFGTKWETKFIIGKPMSNVKVIGYGNTKFKKDEKVVYNNIYFLDSNKTSQEELKRLSPNSIESISVKKGESTKTDTVYIKSKKNTSWGISSKRNNVIYTTKDTIYTNEKHNILEEIQKKYGQPLYMVNDKEITQKELASINEQNIASVSIIKDNNAIKNYGDKGKNGVVLIKMKNKNSKTPFIKLVDSNLYILDDKEIKKSKFKKLDPDNFESIDILQGEHSVKKYGNKGRNGVIIITTKKEK